MSHHLFLSPQQAQRSHTAAIQVLENTGVRLDHEEAEVLYLEAGAKKDAEDRILIPGKMVQKALKKASSSIKMYRRDGEPSMQLTNGKTYFDPGSDALYNIDKKSGELRHSVLSYLTENVRIVDGLCGYDFVMPMALP